MWKKIASLILRNRFQLIIAISLLTVVMGYLAMQVQLSFEFAKVLPSTDSSLVEYQRFKKTYGEDGAVMVIGVHDTGLFTLEKYNDWHELSETIKNIHGINHVMAISNVYKIKRNDSLNKFDFARIITEKAKTQAEVDSIKKQLDRLPFYHGLIYNKENLSTLMAITFEKQDLNSKNRIDIVEKIKDVAAGFEQKHKVQLHYSGMPFIRTEFMNKVSGEMKLFFALAILVTGIILFVFFRSFTSIIFSLAVVAIGVIWSLATMTMFDYKISILSGLLPSLIMIIGIPNCIFLINKYHHEFSLHSNKIKALARTIETVGVSLFLANVTTAIGFAVFYYTRSQLLVEFGVIAAINVIVTYLITLILIPIILSFLPPPKEKEIKHLEAKRINKFLFWIDRVTHNKRTWIYGITAIVTVISLFGMTKINVIGYVVDDLPKKHKIYSDLRFFEENFKGVLPFEIEIDTKKENGVFAENGKALYKINGLQKVLAEYPEFSKPLSVVEGLKFSYQGFRNGNPKFYILPGATELKKLSEFSGTTTGQQDKLKSFLDSSRQKTRISVQMADVGSVRMKEIVAELSPRIDSIFPKDQYKVTLTGHSLVFLKNNDYLLKNLFESLFIEIILITLVGLMLFRSIRIIVLSKLPCLIPLIITAGIMGFAGINFKPSTILIFTIAFGISSDGTIYFLTKYRHELKRANKTISQAVSSTIMDTGLSMVYTSLILFAGFAIFAASTFGGTVALGILVSITLLVSMFTNLLLLPSILLTLEKQFTKKEIIEEPLIDIDEEDEEVQPKNSQ